MTPDETRRLLGEIAAVDNRKLTPEILRLWHEMLHAFAYDQLQAAVRTVRLNTPDTWITPGHLAQIVRGQLRDSGHRRTPQCEHGITLGAHCHDCVPPPDCQICQPIPGLSDTPENRRRTVASLRIGRTP